MKSTIAILPRALQFALPARLNVFLLFALIEFLAEFAGCQEFARVAAAVFVVVAGLQPLLAGVGGVEFRGLGELLNVLLTFVG